MISVKKFSGAGIDGIITRFLSDFIITSEQNVRVYNYIFDAINGSDISDIIDPGGSGLFLRKTNNPKSTDLIGLGSWDLVTNSILFYTAPVSGSELHLEVATTPEEFGAPLVQAAVERAETAAVAAKISEDASEVSEWNSEASRLTSDSYATQTFGVFVNTYAPDGVGGYTATPTTEYSALHYASGNLDDQADVTITAPVLGDALVYDPGTSEWVNGTIDINDIEDVTITAPVLGESLVYDPPSGDWVNGKVLGLPVETGKPHQLVTNDGVEGDSRWSPLAHNPQIIDANTTLNTGANASAVSPEVADGVTLTISAGCTLAIL